MPFKKYAQKVTYHIAQGFFCLGHERIEQASWLQTVQLQFQKIKQRQSRVFLLGNGGSASIAAHCQVDLVNMLGINALTLHESALLTCFSNDFGYEHAFALLLQKLAQPGDLLLVISSSGSSSNMMQAVESMKALGGGVLSLTGFDENNSVRQQTMEMGGLSVWLPSTHYGEVETGHQLILHTLMDEIYEQL